MLSLAEIWFCKLVLNLSCTPDIYKRGFAKFRDELADCVYFNVSSTVENYVNLCSHRCHNRECYEALMKINDANICWILFSNIKYISAKREEKSVNFFSFLRWQKKDLNNPPFFKVSIILSRGKFSKKLEKINHLY